MLATFAADVGFPLFLVHFHVVAPGADYRHICTLDGILTVVAAAGNLELELVGKRRTMHVIGKVVYQQTVELLLVGA